LSTDLIALAEIIDSLNQKFIPHPAQAEIGRAVLFEGAKKIMAQCGRSYGKTRISAYLNVRLAMETANATNYIFLPFLTQGREVYWTPKVLQKMIPDGWIESENQTEMRIVLKNGSQIKVCGADNIDSYRGVKLNPGSMATFDEFQNFKEEFTEAFMPNLSVNDPVLFIVGTPPPVEGLFTSFAHLAQTHPEWRFFHAPSSANPYVSASFLAQEKERLESMGEHETYIREFEAIFVRGSKRSIFPMTINTPNPTFAEVKPVDIHKWRIMVTMDPAATSVWAVVFILHNPHTKKSIIFDELYVDEAALMTARSMHGLIEEKLKPYRGAVKEIEYCFDESAAFARNEFAEVCDWWLIPSRKSQMGIQGYIDLIRTIFLKDLVIMCAEVPKLRWELAQAEKDDNGRIPDKNNHATDALGYGFQALGLDLEMSPEKVILEESRRAYTMDEEINLGDSLREF
jgi:hypothetical protein